MELMHLEWKSTGNPYLPMAIFLPVRFMRRSFIIRPKEDWWFPKTGHCIKNSNTYATLGFRVLILLPNWGSTERIRNCMQRWDWSTYIILSEFIRNEKL